CVRFPEDPQRLLDNPILGPSNASGGCRSAGKRFCSSPSPVSIQFAQIGETWLGQRGSLIRALAEVVSIEAVDAIRCALIRRLVRARTPTATGQCSRPNPARPAPASGPIAITHNPRRFLAIAPVVYRQETRRTSISLNAALYRP